MKILFNKLKKVNKVLLIIYLITLILYSISYGFLIKNMLFLTNIETALRIIVLIVLGIWLFVYLVWNLINLILRKHIKIAICSAISIILVVVLSIVNYYISMINNNLSNLVEKEYVTYTSNLVTLKDTTINQDSRLGMINNSEDVEGNVLALELVKKYQLNEDNILEYSSYYEMVYDLLEGKIDGTFLNSNYLTIFSQDEFEGLENTKIVYSFSKKMKNQDTFMASNKSLTEPFTILLLGVDSEKDGLNNSTSFNGDTLMMITFNPKTLNATMFSIPRDTYVPIACNHNRYAKINSSAAYGTSCVVSTIEQLTGITIDYYVKINFKGVVDLVEALGGIEVTVEKPDYSAYIKAYNGRVCEQNSLRQFGNNLVCIDPGLQTLNGEEALAYARCRHAYLMSDIARNKHQQQIIEAIAKKAADSKNIGKLEEILEAITNNIDTNISKEKLLSFYEVFKNMIAKTLNDGQSLTIEKTYLEYYNLPVRLSNNGIMLSAIGYYQGSLDAITKLMRVNLDLEEKEMIKTFSFDANKEYKAKVTGEGITTGTKLITMPNFVGLSVKQVEDWTNQNNITLNIEFVDNLSPYYNPNILPGMVANQSVNNGILINNISSLTIYVNKVVNDKVEENTQEQPEENEDNDIDIPDVIFPSSENSLE